MPFAFFCAAAFFLLLHRRRSSPHQYIRSAAAFRTPMCTLVYAATCLNIPYIHSYTEHSVQFIYVTSGSNMATYYACSDHGLVRQKSCVLPTYVRRLADYDLEIHFISKPISTRRDYSVILRLRNVYTRITGEPVPWAGAATVTLRFALWLAVVL